ncbi:MAG: GGDEF domain-containing protein [Rhodocyclaceae bacterium]|nr:GGDEF domain-containing protein [Rhodocyclaceae bacterium]
MQPNRMAMPSKILEHVEAITQHRDTALLDRSMVASLAELIKVDGISLITLVPRNEGFLAATIAWNDGQGVQFQPDLTDDDFVPVAGYPALVKSLECQQPIEEAQDENGIYRYWLPVFLSDMPVACFKIESLEPMTPQQSEMVAGMLALYRNYLSLLEDSQKDTLTGLSNRKTFEYSLARLLMSLTVDSGTETNQSPERRAGLARDHWLCVVDIDHFKRINDRFGHLFGDEVLILVANLMRNSFRQQDRLFRFGGEEFVVLLRNVNIEGARKSVNRFRQNIENHEFPGDVGHITVSVGFSRINLYDTPATVLGQADDALYYAKEHGRNQVHSYEDLVEAGLLTKKEMHSDVELF